MAGNKALKKFSESKIPKKGAGQSLREINIYKDPNTHAEIIGKIKAGESVNWINKSICDNREWIRCDKNQNFGYIIGTEEDGNYNFDVDKITETPEKKSEAPISNNSTLTDEELQLGEYFKNEILNEDDDLKINTEKDLNENSTDSTENNSSENTTNNQEELGLDNLNDLDFGSLNLKIANESEARQVEHYLNEISSEIEKEEKPCIESPKTEENPGKEEPSLLKSTFALIAELSPIKDGYDSIFGRDLISNEKLDVKERLIRALCIFPPFKLFSKANKIKKCLQISKVISPTILKVSQKIPRKLKIADGKIDKSKFSINLNGRKGFKEKKGWYVERDYAGHKQSYWKLKDPNGKRVASLDEHFNIVGE